MIPQTNCRPILRSAIVVPSLHFNRIIIRAYIYNEFFSTLELIPCKNGGAILIATVGYCPNFESLRDAANEWKLGVGE